jgi:pyruvate/2-oxoacid:ferredoxin oxidoreductase alpha subunit
MNARDDAQARETTMLLTGNHAVAWAAKLARPKVVPVYPITPQTPVLELITEFQAEGKFDAEIITPESEHSVMAACIPASLAGVRVFTATASQGILLMHELLHYASGARAPIVMANVNRTLASPWAFWPDETDSLAQRDTGWIQYYVESGQEALDTVIHAFKVAERVLVPAMVNLDAFYVSHALEPVRVPAQHVVDAFLPAEMFCRHRRQIGDAMAQVPGAALEADREWQALTGRGYGVVERYRCDGAKIVVVAMGSLCGTVRDAVDAMRDAGEAVGLLKVRLFRPFPAVELRDALAGVPIVVTLDRDYSPGYGGVLHQELRGALYGVERPPKLHGVLAGVGGVNVPPRKVVEIAHAAAAREPSHESVWME